MERRRRSGTSARRSPRGCVLRGGVRALRRCAAWRRDV